MQETFVISLGGSIVVPNSVDIEFLNKFRNSINSYLEGHKNARLILVIGGGYPARSYQNCAKALVQNITNNNLDSIGIRATWLNAELVRIIFNVDENVVTNPEDANIEFKGKLLIAAGWKPGFSTDTDSVYLAKRFNAKTIINLSNTKGVFTSDPKKDKNAKFIEKISWNDFLHLTGDAWDPGLNVPFDPVASSIASKSDISVICADGHNLSNTIAILENKEFIGTTIGNL